MQVTLKNKSLNFNKRGTLAEIYKLCVKGKLTAKTNFKSDDLFKSYGQMKYLLGSPLGATILLVLYPACTLRLNQVVVPVWMYEILNSSCIIEDTLGRLDIKALFFVLSLA